MLRRWVLAVTWAACTLPGIRAEAREGEVSYATCEAALQAERWQVAADCFVAFFREFPNAANIDQALFNGAFAFEKIHEIGKAIQLRIYLLKEAPGSPLAEKTIYMIGGNYHALAEYSEAAKFYELYASHYPQRPEAEFALATAATFRASLGDHDGAIANLKAYLERYSGDERRSASIELEMGRLMEEKGGLDGAIDRYAAIGEKYRGRQTAEERLVARKELGRLLLERGRPGDEERGEAELHAVVRSWLSLSAAERDRLRRGGRTVSEAHLLIAERLLAEISATQTRDLSKKAWATAVEKKLEAAALVSASLAAIVDIGRPEMIVMAHVTRGALCEHFASVVTENSSVKMLPEYVRRELERLLREDVTESPVNAAVAAYERAIEVAHEKGVAGDGVLRALRRLTVLAPARYPQLSELLPQPTTRDGRSRATFDFEPSPSS